jgi:hypothetical protein
VQHRAIKAHLVPSQIADLGRPQAMPECDQNHRRVAMTMTVGFGGLDQGLDRLA